MVVWVYKATPKKIDAVRMVMLTNSRGFLCRSANVETESGHAKVPLVEQVDAGDMIHVFYREKGKTRSLGVHEVVSPVGHAFERAFGAKVQGTKALYAVEDPTFVFQIDKDHSFEPDPVVGRLTGWCLKRTAQLQVPYQEKLFPFRQTLAQI